MLCKDKVRDIMKELVKLMKLGMLVVSIFVSDNYFCYTENRFAEDRRYRLIGLTASKKSEFGWMNYRRDQ